MPAKKKVDIGTALTIKRKKPGVRIGKATKQVRAPYASQQARNVRGEKAGY